MKKFIFALESNKPEEIEMLNAPAFSVVVSTDDYFKANDCVQYEYEPDEYNQLIDVMGRNNLSELTQSTFEPEDENISRTEISNKLNQETLFNYSQAFQDFIDDNQE